MRSLLKIFWAFCERMMPRIGSSVLIFALALFTSPEVVGVYSWGVVCYTFYQALTVSALRNLVIDAVQTVAGAAFLQRFRIISAVLGCLGIALFVLLVSLLLPQDVQAHAAGLLPIALAPIANAVSVMPVARLQIDNKWRSLALAQTLASVVSLAIALPTLLVTESVLACSIGVLISEVVFAALCVSMVARSGGPTEPISVGKSLRRQYVTMAGYAGITWSQGQVDRVLIGTLSGPSLLGLYSMASTIARSAGDALAASSANLLRAELGRGGKTEAEIRSISAKVLNRGLLMAVPTGVAIVVLAEIIIRPLMGDEWDDAIDIVPILVIAVIPSLLSWSGGIFHIAARTGNRALLAPVTSLLFAFPVAVLASIDIAYAAWTVLFRELVQCSVTFIVARSIAPWKTYSLAVVLVISSAGLVLNYRL